MRKMKKVLSLAMTAAMTASLLTGMGAVTASAKKSDDGKRTKITALLKGTESTEQYKTFDYLLKNFCDEKGLDYEIELVNDMQDYFTKLQMYINSDTLPDIFGCPNGTLSKACKDIDALVNVGGSDAWQLMRYLSFSPWRVTGPEFIEGYQAGTDSFSDNESAKYAVNLLSDLGTKGYFEPGFASVDFTSACNLFFGGSGAIFYTGSGQISLAEEMYDNGELGFFPVPDTEGMDNMSTNVPVHAGFAEGFNKATYDDTMQEFFDYMCENFTDACYNQAQVFSPFNEELPEGLPQLYYDTQPMFEDAETAWTSWDDKLDSDVMTKIVDEQQQLAQGIIKPDEFIKTCDSLVKK